MSIFDKLRGQLIDIIEWNQASNDERLAWRFPRHDNEIKNGAKLIVREGQVAVFVNEGQLADLFEPGTYTLETKNLPILSTLKGWKYGFESPFKAEVYFVSTRRFTDQKWGTKNPIMIRDKEFGPVRIRAFGTYATRVSEAGKFLRELIGTDPSFEVYEISGQLRSLIVTRVTDALASSGLPVLDMAANQDELSKYIIERITPDMAEMGLSVPMFFVENVSLPPNLEEVLDKRASMGILGNLDNYMKFQAAESMPEAMKNPGGMGAMGAQMAAGFGMGQQFSKAFSPDQQQPQQGGGAVPPPLPGAVKVAYFAAIDGAQAGPFNMEELKAKTQGGAITRETLVWKEGMANWTKAGDVEELKVLFASVPPPLPPAM
ncbi:MAG: SPFH domain-containing protein [Sumerlaeia bacterium]